MERPKVLSDRKYPKTFTVKYSTKDISEPQFNQNVLAIYKDPETSEFVIETVFKDIRLPGDVDTEIVIGGD